MTVIDPCDAFDIEKMVPAIAALKGPIYARLLRGNVPAVLDEYNYQFDCARRKCSEMDRTCSSSPRAS